MSTHFIFYRISIFVATFLIFLSFLIHIKCKNDNTLTIKKNIFGNGVKLWAEFEGIKPTFSIYCFDKNKFTEFNLNNSNGNLYKLGKTDVIEFGFLADDLTWSIVRDSIKISTLVFPLSAIKKDTIVFKSQNIALVNVTRLFKVNKVCNCDSLEAKFVVRTNGEYGRALLDSLKYDYVKYPLK